MFKNSLTKYLTIALLLVPFVSINANNFENTDELINSLLDSMKTYNKEIGKIYDSNPYSYTNNEYFESIVNIGTKALIPIRQMIDTSKNNGLREYILAIAAEKIAKVDLKGDSFNWTNAKGWVRVWDIHLRSISYEVSKITNSEVTIDIQIERLVKLGVPALPYILDKIESGNEKYIPSIYKLVGDNSNLQNNPNNQEWVKSLTLEYNHIKEMVEFSKEIK